MKYIPALMACCGLGTIPYGAAMAQNNGNRSDRPNILWLTFEDTSAREFGCYGNDAVSTPNVDSLAANGIQFMNAWSCGPQSSPARSTIITGCYATTYGMDIHHTRYDTPPDIFFPQRLREAGYYCTNNRKTHYNSTSPDKACWDECSRTASYNSPGRKEGQPFFAVFNCNVSHMGCIRTFHTDGRRDYTEEGIYPSLLRLPDYVPDLPEIRSDLAGHLEAVQDIDKWAGIFLKDLRDKGLDGNTIIFFFSDHGGCLPRGKGYLYESGLRVPLIVYLPPKWQHLAERGAGRDSSLVNFTDLAPTVLSLAGIRPAENMQGKALMGRFADKDGRKINYAFAANHLHHFTPARAASDGRYKLLRTYIPYRQFAMRNYYQWGMPGNKAWDRLVLGGHNTNPAWDLPFLPHPAEMLFDLRNDPGEIHDLSADPAYAEVLSRLRDSLSSHIRSTVDLGFFLPTSRKGRIMYDMVRDENYPLEQLYSLAELAGTATPADIPALDEAIASPLSEMRYWATVGYACLARTGQIQGCPETLLALTRDPDPYIAAEASYAISYLGHEKEGITRLVSGDTDPHFRKVFFSALECLSLDPDKRDAILEYGKDSLWHAATTLPCKKNEDAGLIARGILVNLGEMDINDMHGDVYQEGLQLNHKRRPMIPLP